ncbi:MAG: diaminopimelate epimerase [Proteobacteria bacterium]|jgi:diaminopimelate epimerase|nr:diaminopimelate epimerase [Pseudomonadota bacterium]
MSLIFSKMHGLGNDFVVLDAISQHVNMTATLAQALADRRFGVGCDQILLIENPSTQDDEFSYRIFNQDGSEVSQCGNGARCFAKYVSEKGLTQSSRISVSTLAGKLELVIEENGLITVNMGAPDFTLSTIPFIADNVADSYAIDIDSESLTANVLSLGNPHAVFQVDNLDLANVAGIGKALQSHNRFPEQVNAGFMQIIDQENFRLRVFERGVGETLACGSGACAALVVGIRRGELSSQATCHLPGGELSLSWQGDGCSVFKTGPAEFVYDGVWTGQ